MNILPASILAQLQLEITNEVRTIIADTIEDDMLDQYKAKIRPEINEIVRNLCIKQLSLIMSMEQIKNELIIKVEDSNE